MESCDKNDQNDCLTCKRKSPMFKMLSIEELQLIKDNRINIHYKRGEIIQKQGTFMSHAISVNAGLVKVYLEDEGHADTILRIVPPTNFIGGPGIYYDQFLHFTVSALQDSSICLIDLSVFKNILDQNKAFAAEFMSDFSKNVISTYNRLIKLTKNNLPGRVAYALLYLFEEVYDRKENIISITKQDLADLSAISRESAAKILRDFQSEGIIRFTNSEVELLKPEILHQLRSLG
jgi:CRP-like cAMP-binding protein